jgi:hypothetical protein
MFVDRSAGIVLPGLLTPARDGHLMSIVLCPGLGKDYPTADGYDRFFKMGS